MIRPHKLLPLLLVPLLFVAGCTRSYWTTFLNTSGIQASVATKGKISWASEFDENGNPVYTYTKTAPVLNVSLIQGSSPVDLTSLQAQYYSPLADEDGRPTLLAINPINVPFNARLNPDTPSTLTLGELITDALINDTNPNNAERYTDLDIQAKVRLIGRDQLGNSTSLDVTVPITIEVN